MNTALVVFVSCFHILQNFFLIIGYQLVQSSALANKSMLLFFLLCIDTVLTVECYSDEQTNKKTGVQGRQAARILIRWRQSRTAVWGMGRAPCFQSLFFVRFGECFLEFIFQQKFGVYRRLFFVNPQFSEIRRLILQCFLLKIINNNRMQTYAR